MRAPSTRIELQGIIIDTSNMTVALPQKKVEGLQEQIGELLKRKNARAASYCRLWQNQRTWVDAYSLVGALLGGCWMQPAR